MPLKVEVHATAYAYGNSAIASQYPFLDRTTFYNYKVINRSNMDYHDVFLTMWSDIDLGQYSDDYIGCNVPGNYGYAYNGDADDNTAFGINGYGTNPPAAGYQVLKGPYAVNDGKDNDNDGVVDESCEQILMSRFNYFNTPLCMAFTHQTNIPSNVSQYYQYMKGEWKDGMPFACGGNGYGGSVPTPFAYPGNTYANGSCGTTAWNDTGVPGDRVFMVNVGPFNFNKHTVEEFEFAHCTAFDYTNHNPVSKLALEMGMIRTFMNVYDPPAVCPAAVSVKEIENEFEFVLFPNPATDQLSLTFNNSDEKPVTIEITDVCGKTIINRGGNEMNQVTLNIGQLPQGIYFVKLSAEGRSVVRKFVKD